MTKMPTAEAFTIRPLESEEDFQEFEALQKETWGKDLHELVTASLARLVQKVGGMAVGAFDSRGSMLGFLFGFTGYKDGRPLHWSHLLAVRREARDLGIGRKLKLYQRETLLKIGITEVFWTYDPLVAKNAHLNFNCLGALPTEYVSDMYGDGNDVELFRGLGTDRFVLVWRIADDRVVRAIAGQSPTETSLFTSAPVVVGRINENDDHSPPQQLAFISEPAVCVEIPPDIHGVRSVSVNAATEWRRITRNAFQFYLRNNYQVIGFYRSKADGRCFYCLRTKG